MAPSFLSLIITNLYDLIYVVQSLNLECQHKECEQHSCSNIATTPESEHDKWCLALAIHEWLPNAYIEQYAMATLEGGLLR